MSQFLGLPGYEDKPDRGLTQRSHVPPRGVLVPTRALDVLYDGLLRAAPMYPEGSRVSPASHVRRRSGCDCAEPQCLQAATSAPWPRTRNLLPGSGGCGCGGVDGPRPASHRDGAALRIHCDRYRSNPHRRYRARSCAIARPRVISRPCAVGCPCETRRFESDRVGRPRIPEIGLADHRLVRRATSGVATAIARSPTSSIDRACSASVNQRQWASSHSCHACSW